MMRMLRILHVFVPLLFVAHPMAAMDNQSGVSVQGTIREETTSEIIPFVNVVLVDLPDSIQRGGTVTNNQGVFVIPDVKPGSYFLVVSFIGYEQLVVAPFDVKETTGVVDLGDMHIRQTSISLGETEIVGEKSTYELALDRKVYNVGKDLQSNNGSATEVLENVPSVSVDVEGNVSLRGSGNVTYFINGRPSALLRSNPAAALQQIPASSIERIEVITNPSAKYKPDGSAGIINIVLKEEKTDGVQGTWLVNAGNGDRYNTNLNLGITKGKMTAFAGCGLRWDKRPGSITDQRTYMDSLGQVESFYERHAVRDYKSFATMVNGGMEFKPDNKTSLSIQGNAYRRIMNRPMVFDIRTSDMLHEVTLDYLTNQDGLEDESEAEASVAFEHDLKKEDHGISAEVNVATYHELETHEYNEQYHFPDVFNADRSLRLLKNGKQLEAAFDFHRPVGEEGELEAGYEGIGFRDDIRNSGMHMDTSSGQWVGDPEKYSYFRVVQQQHALYGTFGFPLKELQVMTGLRIEQSFLRATLFSLDSVTLNRYLKVYPTLHLSYEVNDKVEAQVNYSRRVNRADGDELNPFPVYSDPRNFESGNPLLRPEQIHSLEAGVQRKGDKVTLIPTLFYRYTFDAFAEVVVPVKDSLLMTTYDNISSERAAGLEFLVQGRPIKRWLINFNSSVFYNEIDASNLGYGNSLSTWTWHVQVSNNIELAKQWMIQWTGRYRAPSLTPQGRFLGYTVFNAGLKKEMLKGKLSLVITASDVFHTLRWMHEVHSQVLDQTVKYDRRSQIVFVGCSWHFGRDLKTKKKDELKFDDGM
ncbi:MAG: TonB-dependent receptor [Flavobacteriales bacterium]|nr:TonB-dependent receptor [Flavobacteriales bacterium]